VTLEYFSQITASGDGLFDREEGAKVEIMRRGTRAGALLPDAISGYILATGARARGCVTDARNVTIEWKLFWGYSISALHAPSLERRLLFVVRQGGDVNVVVRGNGRQKGWKKMGRRRRRNV